MKPPLRFSLSLAAVALATPLTALAHPGHGDPDFTWDFSHLSAHPLATAGCILVLAAGYWGMSILVHRLRASRQKR